MIMLNESVRINWLILDKWEEKSKKKKLINKYIQILNVDFYFI